MLESTRNDRSFGSGIPVIHQGELAPEIREALSSELPYEPFTDRFATAAVSLRVEERWPDGRFGARVALRTAGWRSLPGLPHELAADEDIEDAFLGMATRLPANYIENLTGAAVRYDTNSFQREEHRAYRMEYQVLGDPRQILDAVGELRRANDIRWKKAHTMLGYLPGGEDHSDDRAHARIDRMYGPGTAAAWDEEIAKYDRALAAFFQNTTLAKLPKRAAPLPDEISFDSIH